MKETLQRLIQGKDLTEQEAYRMMCEMLGGGMTPAGMASVLTALRMKGLAVPEIVGAARAARDRSPRIRVPDGLLAIDREEINLDDETISRTSLGNGSGTKVFTVSTATAFVVAGAGQPVAKSGNLGPSHYVSGERVLRALGIEPDITPTTVERCIAEAGVGFLYSAPLHRMWGATLDLRHQMGFRTLLNCIGPLCNPCGAQGLCLGVYEADALIPLARALKAMGVRQGVVVHGEDTLDEVSVTGRSMVCFLRESGFEVMELFPEDVGLPRRRMEEIRGGTAPDNARIIRGVLSGEDGAPADVVLLGAAVALAAAGRAADIREGLERARDAIESGRARRTLETVVRLTTEAAFTRGG